MLAGRIIFYVIEFDVNQLLKVKMNSENLLLGFLALVFSCVICVIFWPKNKSSHQYYIDVLDYKKWKGYDDVYRKVRKLSKKSISETEHDHTLQELEVSGIIERRTIEPEDIEEVAAPTEFGRSHIDRAHGYTTIPTYEYRLVDNSDGGKPVKKQKSTARIPSLMLSHS